MNALLDLLCTATRPNYSKYHTAAAQHDCYLHQTLEGWIALDMDRRIIAQGREIWDVITVLNSAQ